MLLARRNKEDNVSCVRELFHHEAGKSVLRRTL